MISLSQRPLPDNTQHSQQRNIHAPCGIRTHNLSGWATEYLRLRTGGHWDRHYSTIPFPIIALSKACVCSSSFAGIVVSNPTGTWMSVSCECCVFSGRGLCVGPNTRPKECYQVWCVWVWCWSLNNGGNLAHSGTDVWWKIITAIKMLLISKGLNIMVKI